MINHDYLYKFVGENLALARQGKFSQNEIADRLGVTRVSISNIERGEQRAPLSLIYSYCDILNIDISTVLPKIDELRENVSGEVIDINGVARVVPADVAAFIRKREADAE